MGRRNKPSSASSLEVVNSDVVTGALQTSGGGLEAANQWQVGNGGCHRQGRTSSGTHLQIPILQQPSFQQPKTAEQQLSTKTKERPDTRGRMEADARWNRRGSLHHLRQRRRGELGPLVIDGVLRRSSHLCAGHSRFGARLP